MALEIEAPTSRPVVVAERSCATAVDAGIGRHRSDIEGLRAIAVMLVVIYHAIPWAVPGGFIGVDVFFVISGFLITRQLLDDTNLPSRRSIVTFYARRARRILPAAALTTVATIVAAELILSPLDVKRLIGDAWAATTFTMNYHASAQGNNYLMSSLPPSPLLHYWSLSVEEQFYLLWPVLLGVALVAGRRFGRRSRCDRERDRIPVMSVGVALVLLVAASFVTSVVLTGTDPVWAYYALWTRAFELGTGALIAVLAVPAAKLGSLARTISGWSGILAIGLAAGLYDTALPYPGVAAVLPVFGAGAVIVAGVQPDRSAWSVERLLGARPMQWIGARSYSWYLWHFPFLVLAPAAVGRHDLTAFGAIVVAATSLFVAACSYSFVERPLRTATVLVTRPARGLALGFGTIVCAAVALVGVSAELPSLVGPGPPVHLLSSFPTDDGGGGLTASVLRRDLIRAGEVEATPSNLVPSLYGATNDLPITYLDGCHLPFAATSGPPCIFGDTGSTRTVVLFGDSHAAQWFPALEVIARRRNWRLISLTKSGCPPVDVIVTRGAVPFPQCATWRRYELGRIRALRPFLVVTSWFDSFAQVAAPAPSVPAGYGNFWDDGVAATFEALRRSGAEIVYLADTPEAQVSDPGCLSLHLADADSCAGRWPPKGGQTGGLRSVEARIAVRLGVKVINPLTWFCTDTSCPAIVGNVLVRRDNGHMTPQYSAFLAPVLEGALTRVLDRERVGDVDLDAARRPSIVGFRRPFDSVQDLVPF